MCIFRLAKLLCIMWTSMWHERHSQGKQASTSNSWATMPKATETLDQRCRNGFWKESEALGNNWQTYPHRSQFLYSMTEAVIPVWSCRFFCTADCTLLGGGCRLQSESVYTYWGTPTTYLIYATYKEGLCRESHRQVKNGCEESCWNNCFLCRERTEKGRSKL